MKYNLESTVNKDAVELIYLSLLARNIENEELLEKISDSSINLDTLRKHILASQEYRDNILRILAIDYYISIQSQKLEQINKTSLRNQDQDENITIIQTCDTIRYPTLLQVSGLYNSKYAKKWNLQYLNYQGIKVGLYPHHAIFNRIYMLNDLIKQGNRNWIIYLDADSIISDPNYNIRAKLQQLRADNQCFWLHNVYQEDDPKFEQWYHINNGVFAIDLSSPIAQLVVQTWHGIYQNFYSYQDYEKATTWMDIIDDQSSLTKILDIFNLREHVCLEQLQGFFAYQALRQDHQGISSDEEILLRAKSLREKGEEIFSKVTEI